MPLTSLGARPRFIVPSGKRGVAYNDASLVSAFTGNSAVTWAYNWGSSTSSIPSNFNYCPMLWGTGASFTNNWNANADKAIAATSPEEIRNSR